MAVYRQGMRHEDIKKIQEVLAAQRLYGGKIDGIYGSQTAAAVEAYQRAKGDITVDGIAGPETLGRMGLSYLGSSAQIGGGGPPPDYAAYGPSSGYGGIREDFVDYTDTDPTTRYPGLAGTDVEIWKNSDNGKWFAVYFVPGSSPRIPMLYEIRGQDDLKVFFPNQTPNPDETYTQAQINAYGAIRFGTSDALPKTGHPFMTFAEDYERAKEVMPWLNDPEVMAIWANADLQGRPVQQWELDGTAWWQEHNEAERDWLWLNARDPLSAQKLIEDNQIDAYLMFRDAGIAEPPAGLVEYMAMQYTNGTWSQKYLNDQLHEISGGTTSSGLDSGLQSWMNTNNVSVGPALNFTTDVKDAFSKWLGPAFGPSEEQVTEWAAKLRLSPQAGLDELTEYLRGQRLALFPMYENPDLTYEDIASPWRNEAFRVWGQRVDETSGMFMNILKANDGDEAGKILRKQGLKQGIGQVENDALSNLMAGAGGQVRRPV